MRHYVAKGLLLVAFATAASLCAQTSATPDELVAKARALSDIRGHDSPPFHLHAEFQAVLEDGKPQTGTFDLTWTSPGNWKDQVDVSDIHLRRTAVDGKISEDSQPHYIPLQVDWIRNHVLPASPSDLAPAKTKKWKLAKPTKPGEIALVRNPPVVAYPTKKPDAIIDAATGTLIWFDDTDYSNFKPFLGKQVGMVGKCVRGKSVLASFVIRKLETVDVPSDGSIAPKAPATTAPAIAQTDPVHATVIHSVDPQYSKEGSQQRIQGTVLLQLGIDDQGKLREIVVLQSLEPSMDAEAIKAARQYVFKPAQQDGHPVPCIMSVEIDFYTR